MEIIVKIQADELVKAIDKLAGAIDEGISVATTKEKPQKVVDKPKNVEPPKPEPKEEPKAEKEEPQYKIEDIRTAFATFAKAKGKDKAKEILAKFNAHKVTELKEDDYNAVMKVLEG